MVITGALSEYMKAHREPSPVLSMEVRNMVFKKSSYGSALGIVGVCIMLGGAAFILFCMRFMPDELILPYAIFAAGCFLCAMICLYAAVEVQSKVEINAEGITYHSRFHGRKDISWNSCAMIGVFGYNYGMRGWLFFSLEPFACNSQNDCRKYAQKNQKSIIMIDYSPKVFSALEQYAPSHLVSRAKMLMR